ncbi:O-antigen polymerase [Terribacillus sp. JSM ZJ617]|uniref:O-antigen polymerase n=1 Tax=Terribacillus sp. JSM ZJ617 TaxID=3342119 RepID=UPI0035A96366
MIISQVRVRIYIFLLFISIMLGITAVWMGENLSITFFAMIVSLIPPLLYMVIAASKNKGYIFLTNPLLLYSAFFFVFFGLGGLLYAGAFESYSDIGGKATILGVVGYLCGYLFSKLLLDKYKKRKVQHKEIYKTQIPQSLQFEKLLFIIGFVGYCLYIIQIGQIPLLMNNLEQARVDASLKGGAILNILSYFLIFSSTIGFLNYMIIKVKKLNIKHHSIIRYLLAIAFLLSLGNRAPVFSLLFSSLLIFIFVKYKGKIKLPRLLLIGVLSGLGVFIFVGGFGAYRVINTTSFHSYPEFSNYLDSNNYLGLMYYVFTHYLTVGFENFMRVLVVVPDILNFRFGTSYFDSLLTILPGTQYTLDMQIKMALNQTYLGGGTVPSVLGEAFANFGVLGWFIVPFISMFLLKLLYNAYQGSSNNLFNIVIYIYLLNHFSNSLLSGLAASSILPFVTIFIYLTYGYFISKRKGVKYGKVISNDIST